MDHTEPKSPADVKPPQTIQEIIRQALPAGMAPHAVMGTRDETILLVLGLCLIVLAFLPTSVVRVGLLALGGAISTWVILRVFRRDKAQLARDWACKHLHECERGHIWSHWDTDACACLLPGRNQVNPHVSALNRRGWKARCGTIQAADCPECQGQFSS